MDELFVIGLAILAFVLITPLYLLFAVKRLKDRIETLEARLLGPGQAPAAAQAPLPDAPQAPPAQSPVEAPGTAQSDQTPPEEAPSPSEPAAAPSQPASAWNPAPRVKPKRKAFVFSGARMLGFSTWAKENWVFILAGVSLALAGVFLVQYGVENGLLSPTMRVVSAIGLGLALIGGGEFVRRKSAGDEDGSFALLPSVFAGAGLVAVFAGVLSARMLYGLIGAEAAFAGLALTGAFAILLGWIYGPLLAALGVFGALLAPFLVGGDSNNAGPLHFYFALIAAVALAIDAYKRWAWLSALALIGAFAASGLLFTQSNTGFHAVLFAFITALGAVAIPVLSLTPRHAGKRLSGIVVPTLRSAEMAFPTRVAGGSFMAAHVYIWLAYQADHSLFWLVLMTSALLLLAAIFWMKDAPALADLAFAPPLLALAVLALEAMDHGRVYQAWVQDVTTRDVLDSPPATVLSLLAGALLASLAFAWRSYKCRPLPVPNAIFAAGFAPWAAIVIELRWAPSYVLGAGSWAIYLALIAAAMVALTERFARIDPEHDRTRTALFAMSAMSMIAFVAVVLLGGMALTLAFAVMVLAAAWLGERFKLRLLDWYVQIGVVAVSYRLVMDPGVFWGFEAALWEVLLVFLGVVGLLAAAWLLKRKGALSVIVVLESAIWTLLGILLSLLLVRWHDAAQNEAQIYVVSAYGGLVWLMLTANQLYRLKAGGRLKWLRIALAGFYGLAALFFLGLSTLLNPVVYSGFKAVGWPVFGSLGQAYLLPAIVLGIMAWKLAHLHRALRACFWVLAAGLAALFVALEIRHFWQGDNMASYLTLKPELYSYTVAMILAALGLLALAFIRQSAGLRKLALFMVVVVMAKVFFVDMSGLDGLLRAASFLVLGLVAALMAWVNRLLKANEAAAQAATASPDQPPQSDV